MGRLSDQHGNGSVLILGLLIMLTGGLLTLLQPLVFKFIGLAIFTFGMLGSHSVALSLIHIYHEHYRYTVDLGQCCRYGGHIEIGDAVG